MEGEVAVEPLLQVQVQLVREITAEHLMDLSEVEVVAQVLQAQLVLVAIEPEEEQVAPELLLQ